MVDRVLRARVVSTDSTAGRVVSILAVVVVAVGAVLSARALELSVSSLRPVPFVALLAVSVSLLFLNAEEFRVTSAVAGSPVDLTTALRVTTIASATNVLPVPAGALVRIQGMREAGVDTRRAASASIGIALWWLAIAGGAAAVAVAVRGNSGAGGLVAAGAVGVAVVAAVVLRAFRPSRRTYARILATEGAFVLNAAIRFHLVLLALDVSVAPTQSAVLAASSSLASAVGVVPGSFGVAEGIAALLGAAVSLPASAGFLATVLLRLISIALVGVAATWFATRRRVAHG